MPDRERLEKPFRQAVEAAPNAMVMINPAGRVELVNAQAEQVFGYSRVEILGQPVEILLPERLRRSDNGSPASLFASPRSHATWIRRDLYALRKDGSEFPVEVGLNPIETDHGPMVLSAFVDISHLKKEEERIQAALKEKDILLGEIHHRVKNNLQMVYSLLGLQSARVTDPAALDLLRDSQNRIRSMALIHQTLYGSKDFLRVDFPLFVRTLLPNLIGSYGVDGERIAVRLDVEPVRLPIDAALPCGLMLNELITNAFKHAFRGRARGEVHIALSRCEGNEARLSVSDDGVGLDGHIDTDTTKTLGLRLVGLLANQLNGMISIHRRDPTEISVRFPF